MNLKSLWIGWLALFVCAAEFSATASERRPGSPPAKSPHFQLLESDSSHVVIEYERPKEDPFLNTDRFVYVGIPVDASYEIQYRTWDAALVSRRTEAVTLSSETPSPLDATVSMQAVLPSLVQSERMAYQELDVIRLRFLSYAASPIKAEGTGYNRDQIVLNRLVLDVRWSGGGTRTAAPSATEPPDAGYPRLYRALVINGADTTPLRRKRSLPEEERTEGFRPSVVGYTQQASPRPATGTVGFRTDAMKVRSRQEGVTAIRYQDVAQQGIDPKQVALGQLRLWDRGREVPLCIQEDGDGVMGEQDVITFYALPTDSEYTNDRIYFLTWFSADSPPLRIETQPMGESAEGAEAFRVVQAFDEDRVLAKEKSNQYKWFLKALDRQDTVLPLTLPCFEPIGDIAVTLRVLNNSRARAELTTVMGGQEVMSSAPVGEYAQMQPLFTAAGLVENVTLQILLDSPPEALQGESRGMSSKAGDEPFVFVDTVEAVYSRNGDLRRSPVRLNRSVLDATTKAVQLRGLENGQTLSAWLLLDGKPVRRLAATAAGPTLNFLLPEEGWDRMEIGLEDAVPSPYTLDPDFASGLHHPDQGSDYLILAHGSLLSEARRLEDLRRADGFDPMVVDVQDIYDEFNDGYPDSQALRRFLRYTQSVWNGRSPEFVVLVGDSSWDHRDREQTGSVDQVPTYAPVTDPQKDGSDEWYTHLWGTESDYLSDVILGRISVRKPEELAHYIQKVITYQNETPVGPWKARNLFITDDTFETYSRESARESLPPQFVPGHIDQVDFPHVTNPYLFHRFVDNPDASAREYTNKKYCPDCTLAILKGFNEGALIVQYIGHGGNQIWSHERIFYGTDRPYSNILELEPTRKFPFIINWSCLTGYLNFNVPPFNVCLAEEFIRYADKGGIAMWAPSGSGSTDQHMLMTHIVNRSLIRDGLTRLGEATTATKIEYLQIQYHPDLMHQYILFGDPGVVLAAPSETLTVTAQPGLFTAGQESAFSVQAQIAGFSEGKAVVALTVDGELKYQSEPIDVSGGQLAHSFPCAFGEVQYPTAAIGIYAWNEEQNRDAWGGVSVSQRKVDAVLRNGQAEAAGEETVLRFDVGNPTSFPVGPVDFRLDWGEGQDTIAVEELPAGATQTVEWKGGIPENVRLAYVSMPGDPAQGISATKPAERLIIPVRSDPVLPVVALVGRVSYSTPDLIEGSQSRFQIPVKSFDPLQEATAMISLRGPGAATEEQEIVLRPLDELMVDLGATVPEMGEHEYTVRIRWNDQEQESPFAVQTWGKPDLALSEGDYRIEPAQPSIGKTVLFRATIYNMGEGPASDVTVAAYDGDPSKNQRLQSFNNRRQPNVRRLEPGESQEITVVWDPVAYDGLGPHDIYLVADSYERVEELSEENNRIHFPVTLANLPDLKVDPWQDLDMSSPLTNGLAVWGQPLHIQCRVRNGGESDAEYVRLSVLHNSDELARFFPLIPPNGVVETAVDVPMLSAKNTLRIHVDKYDLIGEKGEVADQPGNNISLEKRLYVQMQMPEAPVVEKKRVYRIETETPFASGVGEYLIYDARKEHLRLHPQMDQQLIHLQPAYVKNPEVVTTASTSTQWHWSAAYNQFMSPTKTAEVLRVTMPAPNGIYDVYLQLYSRSYEKDATTTFQYRTGGGETGDFVTFTHGKNTFPRSMHKIGTYHIKDDQFLIDLRAVPGSESTAFGDIQFVRSAEETPISSGYTSAYLPAKGSGGTFADMSWDAEIPEGTELYLKARWIVQEPNGAFRFSPWSRAVDGREGRLRLPGKGDYYQFYVNFVQTGRNGLSPALKSVTVSLPAALKATGS